MALAAGAALLVVAASPRGSQPVPDRPAVAGASELAGATLWAGPDGTRIDRLGCRGPRVDELASGLSDVGQELTRRCAGGAFGPDILAQGPVSGPRARDPEDGAEPGRPALLGDVDGDGVRDLALARVGLLEVLTVDVRSGADGDLLWSTDAVGDGFAFATTVDAAGAPGVGLLTWVRPAMAVPPLAVGVSQAMLEVLDAGGQVVWEHNVVGVRAAASVYRASVEAAWVAGVANLVGDATHDIAVARLTSANINGDMLYLLDVDVLDGATGEVAGSAGIEGRYPPSALLIDDLDGDGRDELALTHSDPDNQTDLGVWTGAGRAFYQAILPPTVEATVATVGDLDGDGLRDVVVSGPGRTGAVAVAVSAVDDGTQLWRHDAGDDLVAWASGSAAQPQVGLTEVWLPPSGQATASDAVPAVGTVHLLLDRDGTISRSIDDRIRLVPEPDKGAGVGTFTAAQVLVSDAGEVDGDGRGDRWFTTMVTQGVIEEAGQERITARSGAAGLRSGADLGLVLPIEGADRGQVRWPLRLSVDGDGADLLTVERVDGVPVALRLTDGTTGRRLARVGVVPGTSAVDVQASHLDLDGHAELVVLGFDGSGPTSVEVHGGPLTQRWWTIGA